MNYGQPVVILTAQQYEDMQIMVRQLMAIEEAAEKIAPYDPRQFPVRVLKILEEGK